MIELVPVASSICLGTVAGAAAERTVSVPSCARPLRGSGTSQEPLDVVCADVSAEHGGEKPVVSIAARLQRGYTLERLLSHFCLIFCEGYRYTADNL